MLWSVIKFSMKCSRGLEEYAMMLGILFILVVLQSEWNITPRCCPVSTNLNTPRKEVPACTSLQLLNTCHLYVLEWSEWLCERYFSRGEQAGRHILFNTESGKLQYRSAIDIQYCKRGTLIHLQTDTSGWEAIFLPALVCIPIPSLLFAGLLRCAR